MGNHLWWRPTLLTKERCCECVRVNNFSVFFKTPVDGCIVLYFVSSRNLVWFLRFGIPNLQKLTQQTLVLMKTSWRRLLSSPSEDVLIKKNMFALALRLQDVLVKKNIPANTSTLFQRCLLVDATSRRGATSNQRWNNVVYFDVEIYNVESTLCISTLT